MMLGMGIFFFKCEFLGIGDFLLELSDFDLNIFVIKCFYLSICISN